jgi:hypothetical protein
MTEDERATAMRHFSSQTAVPNRFFAKFKNANMKMRYRGPRQEGIDFTRAASAMCEMIQGRGPLAIRALEIRHGATP